MSSPPLLDYHEANYTVTWWSTDTTAVFGETLYPFDGWSNRCDRDRFHLIRARAGKLGRQIRARANLVVLIRREALGYAMRKSGVCRPGRIPRQRGHLGWVRRGGKRPL